MIRTCDQRIRSPLLYPAELRAELKWLMVFLGTVFLVQKEDDDSDDAQAKPKNESRKHAVSSYAYNLISLYMQDLS